MSVFKDILIPLEEQQLIFWDDDYSGYVVYHKGQKYPFDFSAYLEDRQTIRGIGQPKDEDKK